MENQSADKPFLVSDNAVPGFCLSFISQYNCLVTKLLQEHNKPSWERKCHHSAYFVIRWDNCKWPGHEMSRNSEIPLHYKPAPCESDKDASQPLPPAESWMWQTAQHQLERCEPNPLQPPGVSWRHTGPNVVVLSTYREDQKEIRDKKQHNPQTK